MTSENVSAFIKNVDPEFYILVVFKHSNKLNDKIILVEIKFFKNKNDLMEHVKSKNYVFLKNPSDENQEKIKKSLNLIRKYLLGRKINLYDEFRLLNVEFLLELKFSSPFSYKIIQTLLTKGYGELTSYSQLGEAIGSKAYRAIGTILKKNPLPLVIPCHRVVKKAGQTGGFMGKMNSGWEIELKRYLINLELAHI